MRLNSGLFRLYTDDRSPQALLRVQSFYYHEAFDPASDYDLIVTNNPISLTQRIPVYYLKYDLDMIDLANIRQMIYQEEVNKAIQCLMRLLRYY